MSTPFSFDHLSVAALVLVVSVASCDSSGGDSSGDAGSGNATAAGTTGTGAGTTGSSAGTTGMTASAGTAGATASTDASDGGTASTGDSADTGIGDCPAEPAPDTLCVNMQGSGTVMFYFKTSSGIADRWRAWTDDADENARDSLQFIGTDHKVAQQYLCTMPNPPLIGIKLRVDDLGDSSVKGEWLASNLQQTESCTIDITHTAMVVGDIYGGNFEAVLKNVADGASKSIKGVFRRTLQ